VKLRQFQGRDRHHVAVDTHTLPWQPTSLPGVDQKLLYRQAGYSDQMRLERWKPQTSPGVISYQEGVELFVLDGGFVDDAGAYSSGCWLRLPAGSEHRPRSAGGCAMYVKTSGLPYLRSA
jgi:ChrR Cupin-like domain